MKMRARGLAQQVKNPVIKRDLTGYCNICKSVRKFTWDHVPPKGSTSIQPVQQQTILQNLAARYGGDHRYSISQNGVKFRTLCATCNNERLGTRYDPILNDFTQHVVRIVTTRLALPPVVRIETDPASLIRAVFGHLLAAKGRIEDTIADQAMRAFFLDDTLTQPNRLKVFFWLHPYHNVVIVRDAAMPAVRGRFSNGTGLFSILKYFPLGFVVVNLDQYEGLSDLTNYARISSGATISMPMSLTRIEHPRWPELVDDTNFLVGGQSIDSSILAEPCKG